MSKIYITGDIHGENSLFRFSSKKFPKGNDLTRDDYVIIAGDFGLLWNNTPNKQELYNIKWLDNKPWTTLFIDGNHENFYRLGQLLVIDKFGGKVGVVSQNIFHLKRGEVYSIGGKTFFCFGGAYSWDRDGRKLGLSYWDEEIPNVAEMEYGLKNLEKVQYKVDYVVTHTVPKILIAKLGFSQDPSNMVDPTKKYLDHIANSVTFKRWYFGHMHVDIELDKFRALFNDIEELV